MGSEVPGFERGAFSHAGRTREVFRAGSGPGVVVVHEMPGIHPGMVEFAQRLVDAGYTVFLPSLFGHPVNPRHWGRCYAPRWRSACPASSLSWSIAPVRW